MMSTIATRLREGRGLALFLLALMPLLFTGVVADAQAVYPPNTVFAAGTVYPSADIKSGSMAGGYFGNGSGKTFDVAVTNSTGVGWVLSVFPGNGDGTFAAPQNYSLTTTGWGIIHDGLNLVFAGPLISTTSVDLVVTDDTDDLFVIPGNGDGTFGAPIALNQTAYTLNVFPDPGGSGLLDLATSYSTYNAATFVSTYTVTVLTNQGGGNFTAQKLQTNSSYAVGEVDYLGVAGEPTLMIVGASPDEVSGATGGAMTSTLANGSWSTPAAFNLNLPSGFTVISNVTPFTLNGNIGFAALSNGWLYTWLGNGSGSFQTSNGVSWYGSNSTVQLGSADLNGDGIPDLVALGGGAFSTAQTVLPLYGNSAGDFSIEFETGPGVYGSQFVIGDANGDGHPDIILMEPNQGLTVLLNQGDGTFPHSATSTPKQEPTVPAGSGPVTPFPLAMATADLTGDQLDDVVVVEGLNPNTRVTTNSVDVFTNRGNGELVELDSFPVGSNPVAIAIAPVNGKQSLFVANSGDANIGFLQGNGDGTFQNQTTFTGGDLSTSGASPELLAAGSIDATGFPGVVVADNNGNIIVFTYSSAIGAWSAKATYSVGTVNGLALADLNGGGYSDIVATIAPTCGYSPTENPTLSNASLTILPANGDGTFGSAVTIPSSLQNWDPGKVVVGPLTGQSNPDVIVLPNPAAVCGVAASQIPNSIAIFSGASTGSVTETDVASPLSASMFQYQSSGNPPYGAVADVNGDGANDLIVAEGGLVAVLPGTKSTSFGAPSVQIASSDTEGFASGAFFATGNTSSGHDVVNVSTQGVTPLEPLFETGLSAPLQIGPASLAAATASTTYTQTFTATGGSGGYTFAESGSLPPGITFSGATLSGTPTKAGSFPIAIMATDSSGAKTTANYTLVVNCPVLTMTPASGILTPASTGIPYEQAFTVQGNTTGAFGWTITGNLPIGLSFNGGSETVTTVVGTTQALAALYTFGLTVTDSAGCSVSNNYELNVDNPLTVDLSPSPLPAATTGQAYSAQFTASGGTAPYTYLGLNIPPGLSVSTQSGALTGTPTQSGSYKMTVVATDSQGVQGLVNATLSVQGSNIQISPATLPAAAINTAYSQTFTAANGSGGYTFSESGALPAGIIFSGATLSGTPAKTGSFPITITATDSSGNTGSANYNFIVNCPSLTITPEPETLPPATIGLIYDVGFTVTGTTGAFTWSTTGSIPAGLTFTGGSSTGATLAGKAQLPTGLSSFALSVTDSAHCSVENNYLLGVYSPLTVGPTTLPSATVGQAYSSNFTASGGTGPYIYFTLSTPPGLTLNAQTGALAGTPTQSGSYSITVVATDSIGVEGVVVLPLTVQASSVSISDEEMITVTDGPQAQLIDVSDTESILVTDTVTVTPLTATSVVLTGPASAASGQSVTFTAMVSHSGSGTPTGSAVFSDGALVLATVPITSSGVATYSTNTLSVGAHSISADYGGDSNFSASQSATLSLIVQASTTTALAISPSPAAAGQPVTFTATVASAAAGTPSGSVTFQCLNYAPGQSIVSPAISLNNGIASWTTTSLPAFDYNNCFTAIYSGDQNFLSSASPDESLTVGDFQMNFSIPSSLTLFPGQSSTFTLTVTPSGGAYDGTVVFSSSGAPPEATVTFNPTVVTPGSSPVTVDVTITAPPLSAQARLAARPLKGAPLLLAWLLPLLGLQKVRRKLRRTYSLLLLALFSLVGIGGLIACGKSGFFDQPPKTYSIVLTGTSGTTQHSTTINLTVE
ncbi:MAG: putative Ig domain-containing protein [Terracidiphilus sp.]